MLVAKEKPETLDMLEVLTNGVKIIQLHGVVLVDSMVGGMVDLLDLQVLQVAAVAEVDTLQSIMQQLHNIMPLLVAAVAEVDSVKVMLHQEQFMVDVTPQVMH